MVHRAIAKGTARFPQFRCYPHKCDLASNLETEMGLGPRPELNLLWANPMSARSPAEQVHGDGRAQGAVSV